MSSRIVCFLLSTVLLIAVALPYLRSVETMEAVVLSNGGFAGHSSSDACIACDDMSARCGAMERCINPSGMRMAGCCANTTRSSQWS